MAETVGPSQRNESGALNPRLQCYANQSLPELTEKLIKCSREEKGQNLTSKTRDIIYVLKAHKLRHSLNAHAFYNRGGVEALLSLLTLCAGREGRDRGLLLATLGNLCALHLECCSKVMKQGLADVVSVLTHAHSPATLGTTARLLANMALDPHNIPRLREMGVVRELSHTLFFQTGLDSPCKLSMLRAVRLLSNNSRCREEIKTSEGLPGLMDCLKSAEEKIATSALHTLHVLLQDKDPEVIQALATNMGLPQVVQLSSHGDHNVSRKAVEILVSCAKASEGRVSLSSAGGVECLLQHLDSNSSLFAAIATALCASCRDVLGRQRMRDSGGLERLILMLMDPELALLHGDILSALVCYYFDEHSLKFMVKRLGLLRALSYQLQQMLARSGVEQGEIEEEEEGSGKQVNKEGEWEEESEQCSNECEQEVVKDKTPIVVSDVESAEYSSSSSHTDSPLPSGFDLNISARSSSLPSTESKEDVDVASINQGSPSKLSWSSPSCPSSLSPSPPHPSLSPSPPHPSLSPSPPQEPPPKRQRLCSDVDFARPMPANFLDSLLSSPSPYQTPSRQPDPPLVPDLSPSLESHVVQLLSRVSHLRDCLSHLASQDLLLAMLGCFISSPSSLTSHIFKTLSRIFASPHCFQEVIHCLIPSKLYEQLYHTPHTTALDSSPLLSDDLDLSSPVHTLPSPPYFPLSHRLSLSPCLPQSNARLGYMCQDLLSRLSRVGESPYGQGVLAHMLLTGEERDKEASALAAPLLCRLPRVCQKLMLDYRGQAMLVQLLNSASSALRDSAADSLLALASTADYLLQRKLHGPTLNTSGSSSTPSHSLKSHPPVSLFPLGMEPRWGSIACRYHDSDHYPFDFEVLLIQNSTKTAQHGSGTQQTIRLPVHRTVLMEASEVFNVMLGRHYLESGYREVLLKDVHPQAFRSILHHIYGCGWLCTEVTADFLASSHDQSCDHSNISDSIVAAVSSNFDLPNEHVQVSHTLRCLATASQFLLSSLCGECEREAATYLSKASVVPLFMFSQLHQSCWLAEECMRYVTGLPPSLQRRLCLLELAHCGEGDTALDMLQRLVTAQLQTS